MERKLTAILSADVKGYSRLMGEDEEATIRTLTAYRAVMTTRIQQQRGRVVDSPGDNLLAEFVSVVDAVRCAVEIQQALKAQNDELPDHRQMEFRIGINLGDVVVEGERLYGDGVNIAARLESLAEPGGICISSTVYEQVENKLALTYEDLGEQTVKNIPKPVRVWRVVMDEAAAALAKQGVLRHVQHERESSPVTLSRSKEDRQSHRVSVVRRVWVAGVGLVLIVGVIVAVRYLAHPLLSPQDVALRTEAAPAALSLPDKPSIVVLPFVNMSKDPDQEYFSDGLTDVLTGDLSRISSLFVIARNTAFTYKGKAVNMQEIRKELGVRYVLEGSIQKAGDQVRIVTQLIDTTTDSHLWSERYDRPLKDIFALQDEIVQKIVMTLKLQLTLQEQGFIVRKHTDNLEAYDTFLRGVEYFWRFTHEANTQARQLFERARALDSQYAEAYAYLSWTYHREWVLGWNAIPQTLERSLMLAQQAIALDDSLPLGHSLLSTDYALEQQYDAALAEGERAVALDPNNADSHAWQAEALLLAGRTQEALQAVKQAMRLNPRSPFWYFVNLGWAYLNTGRYAEAIVAEREALSHNPNHIPAHFFLASSYFWQWVSQQSPDTQTLEPAVAVGQRGLALNESYPISHIILGYLALYQRQYAPALAEMERAVALAPTEAWGHAALAQVLSYMGRSEEALQAATQALRLKPGAVNIHLSGVGTAYAMAGHYEEAIAALQHFLSTYPDWLPFHLMLAAAYSELGRTADAQKEAAEVLRINPTFSLDVHKQRVPIKDPAVLERHIAALHKAGLK
jgi:adenylate cyclase